jgi:hypothetical protein
MSHAMRRMITLCETLTQVNEAVHDVPIRFGYDLRIIENPNRRQLQNLLTKAPESLRMIVDDDGNLFVWDATESATHYDVIETLGLDWAVYGFITEDGIGLPEVQNTPSFINLLRKSKGIKHALGAELRVFGTDAA